MKKNAQYGQSHYPMGEAQYVGKLDVSQGKLGIGVKGKPRSEAAPKCNHYGVLEKLMHGHRDVK